jgi:hypothetical protein
MKEVKLEDLKITRNESLGSNPEMIKLLQEKEILVKKGSDYQKKIEKMQKEQQKVGLKLNKIKEKIIPMIEEIAKDFETNQWEVPMSVTLLDGKPVMTILDRLEMEKEKLINQNNKLEEDAKEADKSEGDSEEPVQ